MRSLRVSGLLSVYLQYHYRLKIIPGVRFAAPVPYHASCCLLTADVDLPGDGGGDKSGPVFLESFNLLVDGIGDSIDFGGFTI